MDVEGLKHYIIDHEETETVLSSLNCHHIRRIGEKYVCANPDGDNLNAVCVFADTLSVVNYTRDLSSLSKHADLFTLVQFYNNCNFFDALKWVCNVLGISRYDDFETDLPESVVAAKLLLEMIGQSDNGDDSFERKPIRPVDEHILSYYLPYSNSMFVNDGISDATQHLFGIGYDEQSNRITIPIRDYDGTLVGVKGRLFKHKLSDKDLKYVYMEPCPKGKLLYGIDQTLPYIQEDGFVFVGESEKSVLQMYSYGDKNCVATGGKMVTQYQATLLSRLAVDVILCFDKDVQLEELQSIAEKFLGEVNVYAVYDTDGLLGEHESPSDHREKWEILKDRNIITLREAGI